nr:uncharacterized protein LOC128698898 [Cherax quadricarinatus]
MVAPVLCVPLCTLLLSLVKTSLTYKISTVDSAGVCNETIWLEEGAKSAAILRLTAKDFYDFAPLHCQITFKAPKHTWSGLTGVLEEVDLRRYEDTTGHHLAQSECIDYFMVVSDSRVPQQRQCGSWSVSGHEQLTHLGYRRALVGYCPTPPANDLNVPRCGVTELTVEVSVGQRDSHYLWRDTRWRPHRGFTFVVTAYRYSYHESGCAAGFRSCGTTDHTHKHHCVHQSLWCDHHINCGQPHNYDEISCLDDGEPVGGDLGGSERLWESGSLGHQIYQASDIPSIRYTKHQIYQASDIPSIRYTKHQIYQASDIPSIRYTKHQI